MPTWTHDRQQTIRKTEEEENTVASVSRPKLASEKLHKEIEKKRRARDNATITQRLEEIHLKREALLRSRREEAARKKQERTIP